MTNFSLLQLWQHGTRTCRVTPATERSPYWVIVHDGELIVVQASFKEHDTATYFAVEELRRATGF